MIFVLNTMTPYTILGFQNVYSRQDDNTLLCPL